MNFDKNLIRRFKEGDQKAFEEIFEESKGNILNFVRNSIPKGEDAESLVQEIFVNLWMSRANIDEHKSFNAYIYTIGRNQVYNYLKRLLHQKKYLESISHESRTSYNEAEFWEFENYLYQCIEELPPRRKEIFKLAKIEGKSYREIASTLNISENTVDVQLRKAKTTINSALKDYSSLLMLFLINN
ncbi:RNA polymerase sigma-70 factor [Puteibacter caeruleilacunae]|nr:RNA polymerase sigma-70 factor [Puteibacter caeruleilacunae]